MGEITLCSKGTFNLVMDANAIDDDQGLNK